MSAPKNQKLVPTKPQPSNTERDPRIVYVMSVVDRLIVREGDIFIGDIVNAIAETFSYAKGWEDHGIRMAMQELMLQIPEVNLDEIVEAAAKSIADVRRCEADTAKQAAVEAKFDVAHHDELEALLSKIDESGTAQLIAHARYLIDARGGAA